VGQTAIEPAGINFDFTEEQKLFRQTLRELVDAEFSKDYCREVEARGLGYVPLRPSLLQAVDGDELLRR
jgi:hypothetical protein